MTEKLFNCHVKFSKMPNGIMVLDYTKKGKEQTIIEDISREKAHRVRDRLNELAEENEQLKFQLKECREHKLFSRRELEKENEQLKQTIENICKDYEEAHGMDIRNAEWFKEW